MVCGDDRPDEIGKKDGQKGPEVGEDLADVVAATAKDGEEGIADGALEGAAGETPVGFHVADLGLDGAATPEQHRYGPWKPIQDWLRANPDAARATP